jgi:hypothetical protein
MTKGHVPWLFGFTLGVLLLLGAALAVLVTASARADTAAPVTYTDPVADATNGGPDITSVSVSNNGDLLTFVVTVTGLEVKTGVDEASVYAWLDTDENAATGDPYDGTEYGFMYAVDSGGVWSDVGHWVTDHWESLTGTSMTFEKTGDTATFTIPASDLGATKAFGFDLDSGISGGEGYIGGDLAPDGAPQTLWHYTLTTAPVTPPTIAPTEPTMTVPTEPATTADAQPPAGAGALAGLLVDGSVYVSGADLMWHQIDPATFAALGYDANTIGWFYGSLPGTIGDPVPAVAPAPTETAPVVPLAESVNIVPVIGAPMPAKVTAGKTVVITFPVVNGVTGEKLTSVTMIASAPTVGGKLIRPHVERFTNGVASVGLKVPTTTKAKQLKVKLTINAGTATATRVATIAIT